MVYGSQPRTGSKYQAGDQASSGQEILRVSKKTNMQVKAWVNAIDIPVIEIGKVVSVSFDAIPDTVVVGQISKVSAGGLDKKDWGDGLYYEVEIKLNSADEIPLLPGMSALIVLNEV